MKHTVIANWAEEIPFASIPGLDRRKINGALRPARNDTCRALIGNPRGSYTQKCQKPEDPNFIALLETADFGPFRATGIRPAVRAIRAIMDDIAREKPDIHARLGTAGMLCCRLVRGSTSSISNHAWGTAIDLKIDGRLDIRGDGRVQRGLLEIAPIFRRHKFYWGAAFPTEDSMHFEASDQLVREWSTAGELGPRSTAPSRGLAYGDRGGEVLALQEALNRVLPTRIAEDGVFGKDTRGAVIAFQTKNGLKVTGHAGQRMLSLLKAV